MQSQIESGAQLLARLSTKPSLRGLDDTLFPEGPRNTDIIEIDGERSTGKTLLLSQILAKCILPNYHGSIQIKGCNASAILINTDHHFQVSKLIDIMTNIVDTAYDVSFTSETNKANHDKITVIRNSLHNLHVINCYNSEQFYLTLRTLDDIFLDNTKIALLAIDSITAYYWQDRENNSGVTFDSYIRKLLKIIKAHTTRFDIATMYTRPCETIINYKSKKFMTDLLGDTVDYYKIHLHKIHDLQNFTCTLEVGQIINRMDYSISSCGIKWKVDKGEEEG
ncbi:X-ray repair cross complementing 2 [Ptiloglossa arizonensis]|uniref:X-ray repair cross complementing 2 n=1 Tax=Ptiloglossa arizonensis TaxID=3350558 RepID=UPI003FA0E58A